MSEINRFAVKNETREWVVPSTNETHDVDVGLEDHWLEALNEYQHLILRSVCEGHLNGDRQFATKSMPMLRVVAEATLNPELFQASPSIEEQIQTIFNSSPLSATTDFSHAWSDVGDKEYCFFLDAKRDRGSDQMEQWVRDWFNDAIIFLARVDAVLTEL